MGDRHRMGLGNVAVVWDGEVVGFRGALTMIPKKQRVLVVSDSKEAIATTRQAGQRGKARSKHLK